MGVPGQGLGQRTHVSRGETHRPCALLQRDAVELHRSQVPQRFVVGHGAAAREVAPGAGLLRLVDRKTEHPGQVPARGELHVQRDRRSLLRHVVGVVQRGDQLRRQPRQEQVGGHVPQVARVEEGDSLLEASTELVEGSADAGLGLEEVGADPGLGPDPEPVLGMEVPSPVDVVAEELHHQALEQVGVFPRGTEEVGLDEVEVFGVHGSVRQEGGRGTQAHPGSGAWKVGVSLHCAFQTWSTTPINVVFVRDWNDRPRIP